MILTVKKDPNGSKPGMSFMDVYKALRELHGEKVRLDSAIRALETRLCHLASPGATMRVRRGRRSMSAAERVEVSRRMSNYWAARRAQKQGSIPGSISASAA